MTARPPQAPDLLARCLLPLCREAGSWRPPSRFQALCLPIRSDWLGAWLRLCRDAPDVPDRVELWAFGADLPSADALGRQLAAFFPSPDPPSGDLLDAWPAAIAGLHRIDLRLAASDGRRIRLRLILGIGTGLDLVQETLAGFDAIVLGRDAAGGGGPADARPRLLRALAGRASPGAVLLDAQPDPPGAPAMPTDGWHPIGTAVGETLPAVRLARFAPPPWHTRAGATGMAPMGMPQSRRLAPPERHAAIVGAGLAGCACAAALADRGWRVTLLEARTRPEPGAGQPWLADHPHLSPDDNRLARLTRQALGFSRALRGSAGAPLGRVQLAMDAETHRNQQRSVAMLGPDAHRYARVVDAHEASDLAGIALDRPGVWLPDCDRVAPLGLGMRWLAARESIEFRGDAAVSRIHQLDGRWILEDASGRVLGSAAVVILANAAGAPALAGVRSMPLQSLRAQSTRVRHPSLAALRCILGGDGYAAPIGAGEVLIGATVLADGDTRPRPFADARNLQRLMAMIAQPDRSGADLPVTGLAGWRASFSDRLPAIGALPDESGVARDWRDFSRNDRRPLPRQPGLYGAFGFGSRGLLWASLAAEVLAAMIDAGPVPLQADLLSAIDPARFLRRALRRGQPPLG